MLDRFAATKLVRKRTVLPLKQAYLRAMNAKVTVLLPENAISAVESMAADRDKAKTQILREAIALKSFVDGELSRPRTRLVIVRDGVAREVLFR